ncbi:MAG TPA: hypothetical protein VNZ52_12540 [Candidatus Thermoplasmatota archaeon]|nr:hypothetical protein [Candidatus Thermoplasmatota archaeon]
MRTTALGRRTGRGALPFAIGALLLVPLVFQAAAVPGPVQGDGTWGPYRLHWIDGRDVGDYPGLAVDAEGLAHAIYKLGYAGLWYQRQVPVPGGLVWTKELALPNADGAFLAVDAQGVVHVAYIDGAESVDTVRYARRDPGTGVWTSEVVEEDSPTVGGAWPDVRIALDPTGRVHVSYNWIGATAATSGMKHAWRDPGTGAWHISLVEGGSDSHGFEHDLTADATGRAHLTYRYLTSTECSLRYASLDPGTTSGGWVREVVPMPQGCVAGMSIAVDAAGTPHIAFRGNGAAFHSYRTGANGWVRETIIAGPHGVAMATDIAVDSLDRVHVAYINYFNLGLTGLPTGKGAVHHAVRQADGRWLDEKVDDTNDAVSLRPVLALDGEDRPRLLYPVRNTLDGCSTVPRQLGDLYTDFCFDLLYAEPVLMGLPESVPVGLRLALP